MEFNYLDCVIECRSESLGESFVATAVIRHPADASTQGATTNHERGRDEVSYFNNLGVFASEEKAIARAELFARSWVDANRDG